MLVHRTDRLVSNAILLRHRGHPAQGLESPIRVHRLEVLRPLGPRPQGEPFAGSGNRLIPTVGLQRRPDGLVQPCRSLGVVARQLAKCLWWGLCFLRRHGLSGCGQARDPEPHADEQP